MGVPHPPPVPFAHFNDLEQSMSHTAPLYMPKVEQKIILASQWYIMSVQMREPQSSFFGAELHNLRQQLQGLSFPVLI